MTGERLVDGEQSTTLDAIENERGQARYPDDVPPAVAVDDGQVLTTDLLGGQISSPSSCHNSGGWLLLSMPLDAARAAVEHAVSFGSAEFSGGEVDFSGAPRWAHPPLFSYCEPPPRVALPTQPPGEPQG